MRILSVGIVRARDDSCNNATVCVEARQIGRFEAWRGGGSGGKSTRPWYPDGAMPSTASQSFKFKQHDHIGALAAEQDTQFLQSCFVDTGAYDLAQAADDIRVIIVGRTGTGKSAILQILESQHGSRVVRIEPENLALTYVSNSTVLNFFTDIGVNLDPFFKLLWRHVITVELLNRHFQDRTDQSSPNLLSRLRERFSSDTKEDRERQEAITYLEKWGSSFWKETEFRVKEITRSVETQLEAAIEGRASVAGLGARSTTSGASQLTETERAEIKKRGQEVISKAQVQDLSKVLKLIDGVLPGRNKTYYVVIDGLDEGWVEDRVRYKLIMALIVTARDFIQIEGAKVIIALRRDLMDRVFRITRDSGFQEEKYRSLYLPLTWSKDNILTVLDKRIAHLVARRYTKATVGYREVFPRRVRKVPIRDYLYGIAKRPRDIIAFFNTCMQLPPRSINLTVEEVKIAEGEYSRSRLRAVADEWSADYPALAEFSQILQRRPTSFKLITVSDSDLEELCLSIAIEGRGQTGLLVAGANQVVNGVIPASDFRIALFRVLYKTGIIGLKLERHETASWSDDAGRSVSTAEIDEQTSAVVHPAYHRTLGVRAS